MQAGSWGFEYFKASSILPLKLVKTSIRDLLYR